MAIFRITSRAQRAALAKKSIRYIVHRRSREQSTITRTLYDQYGITDKDAAYSRIDRTGEWGTCFRTVISPDPVLEDGNRDLDLRLLTEATMQELRLRLKDKAFLLPILTETVIRCLSGSDFTMEEIMLGPKPLSIYLCIPENRLKPLAPLIRLVLRTLVTGLTTLYDTRKGKSCRPVLVLADEAGVAPVPALPELAAMVCGRGMSIWADFQDLNQPKSLYGLDRARTLMNSMETQIFTRQSGLETSEYVERRLGRTSDFAHGISVHDAQTTESESEQAVSLLSPQEVAELSETEILCVHRNLKPFRASRIDWREYKALAALTKLTAPPLPALPAPPQIQPLTATTSSSPTAFIDIDALQRKQRAIVSQRIALQEAEEK